MKQTRILMGMPVTVEVIGNQISESVFEDVYNFFEAVDERFSTYKPASEISRINTGQLAAGDSSEEMQEIFHLAEITRQQTRGYFDIERNGHIDPSGIVKGWAIYQAAGMLWQRGCTNFYVDAGGDVQTFGHNAEGEAWRVGIRSPFDPREIVKVVALTNSGIATSGTSMRGQHIYDPHDPGQRIDDVLSLTVIGPNVFDADRYATAAFAMGREGIDFIERLNGFEGYLIDRNHRATLTSGFRQYMVWGQASATGTA